MELGWFSEAMCGWNKAKGKRRGDSFSLSPSLAENEPLLPIAFHGVGRGAKGVCVGGRSRIEGKGKSHLVAHPGNEALLLGVFNGRQWGQKGGGRGGGGGGADRSLT